MTNNDINNEKWIEKLVEKMNNHSESIPNNGWEKLEQELSSTPKPFMLIPHHWRQLAAAAVLLTAIFGAALYFLHGPESNDIDQKVAEVMELTNEATAEDIRPLDEFTVTTQQTTSQHVATHASYPNRSANTSAGTTAVAVSSEESITSPIAKDNDSSENEDSATNETTENKKDEPVVKKVVNHRPSSKDKQHIPVTKKTRRTENLWAFGASVGNAGAISNNREFAFSGRAYQVSNDLDETALISLSKDQTVVFKDGVPLVYNLNDVTYAKHQQPITVGLSVRKSLKRRFSLETGLMFTLLSSDVTLARQPEVAHKQKLYYLGIPVKGNWDFLQSRFITLYLSAGGQIEKCVSGKIAGEKINNKPWQFSVMGGVGVQVNATKNFGIYVEPGVAYYFKNNSSLQTIRKEHPFNFNLVTGLRLSY